MGAARAWLPTDQFGTISVGVNDPTSSFSQTRTTREVLEEGPTSDSYRLCPAGDPGGSVIVNQAADSDDVAIRPSQVSFDSLDWALCQTITVSAVDDDAEESQETVTIALGPAPHRPLSAH